MSNQNQIGTTSSSHFRTSTEIFDEWLCLSADLRKIQLKTSPCINEHKTLSRRRRDVCVGWHNEQLKKKFQGAFSFFLCGTNTQTLRVRPKLGLRLGLNLIQTIQNKVLRPKSTPWDAYANRLIHCVKETLSVVYIICQKFHGDLDNP